MHVLLPNAVVFSRKEYLFDRQFTDSHFEKFEVADIIDQRSRLVAVLVVMVLVVVMIRHVYFLLSFLSASRFMLTLDNVPGFRSPACLCRSCRCTRAIDLSAQTRCCRTSPVDPHC